MILGFSRMRFAEFTLQTDVFTLIQCHKNAFDYFGGYPEEILGIIGGLFELAAGAVMALFGLKLFQSKTPPPTPVM